MASVFGSIPAQAINELRAGTDAEQKAGGGPDEHIPDLSVYALTIMPVILTTHRYIRSGASLFGPEH
jgi:hypothetical protein